MFYQPRLLNAEMNQKALAGRTVEVLQGPQVVLQIDDEDTDGIGVGEEPHTHTVDKMADTGWEEVDGPCKEGAGVAVSLQALSHHLNC